MTQTELFNTNQKLVYRVYSDKIRNLPDANILKEDIIQEGMSALWKACRKFDESRGVKFITYAYKSIENSMKTYLYRQRQKTKNLVSMDAQVTGTVFTYEDSLPASTNLQKCTELQDIFERACAKLNEREIQVVILVKEGYTQTEIGEHLHVHQATIHRILEKVKKELLKIIAYKEKSYEE